MSHGWTPSEKALKQTRRRKGCIGTCMMLSAGEPQRRTSVPWMRECRNRRSERRRNADLESVESVRGRKMRIWRTVDNLKRVG